MSLKWCVIIRSTCPREVVAVGGEDGDRGKKGGDGRWRGGYGWERQRWEYGKKRW